MRGGDNFQFKKFDAGEREFWPLPPSSVFKCKSASPWISPSLFRTELGLNSYIEHETGVVIIGEVLLEEPEDAYSDEDELYYELEKHTAITNKDNTSPTFAVEYSSNSERGIDTGNHKSEKYNSERPTTSAVNPIQTHQPNKVTRISSSDKQSVGVNDREEDIATDIDGIVLKRFREVPNYENVDLNSNDNSGTISGGKKKRKWSPFQKDNVKSKSWKLFY